MTEATKAAIDAAKKARAAYEEAARREATVGFGERRGAVQTVDLAVLAAEAARLEIEARRQVARDEWSTWVPDHAPHVMGRWTQRVIGDDGMPEPQRVEIKCAKCAAEYKTTCSSGRVQEHIQRFSIVHLHK